MSDIDETPIERPGALAAIGRTPVVRLTKLPRSESADVWVKLEGANPTGSYKDRMALAMIEGAERRGSLAPGQTVVEYTGGSTAAGADSVVCIALVVIDDHSRSRARRPM